MPRDNVLRGMYWRFGDPIDSSADPSNSSASIRNGGRGQNKAPLFGSHHVGAEPTRIHRPTRTDTIPPTANASIEVLVFDRGCKCRKALLGSWCIAGSATSRQTGGRGGTLPLGAGSYTDWGWYSLHGNSMRRPGALLARPDRLLPVRWRVSG